MDTLVTTEIGGLADCRALLLAIVTGLDQSLDKEIKVFSVLEQYLATYKRVDGQGADASCM
uniref:Uncharacterized protein n=1 Tax=Peronospora matthiolae TaxID=2874970 RepID=A0AAV1T2K9_9STRA